MTSQSFRKDYKKYLKSELLKNLFSSGQCLEVIITNNYKRVKNWKTQKHLTNFQLYPMHLLHLNYYIYYQLPAFYQYHYYPTRSFSFGLSSEQRKVVCSYPRRQQYSTEHIEQCLSLI